MTATPAKRAPNGFVAQRFPADDPGAAHGPWFLTAMDVVSGVVLSRHTDEAVADWPDLIEEVVS